MAHVLNSQMPFAGTRRFDVHTKRTFMNQPSNRRGSNEELVISEIGQVGTQFDGFAHQTIEDSLYNCFKIDEIATRTGFTKLGIEKVGTLMTRGVLIDVAGLKGVDMLGRHLRDHRAGPPAGAAAAERAAPARRRRHHPHRLGQALGQGQRPLHEVLPRHRRRRRRMAREAGPHARRRRQHAGRGLPQPRPPDSPCPSTRSCSSSTASTCWRT